MNDFEKVVKAIKRVLDTRTSYEVAKALGVPNRTINRYQNGTTPLENMTIATARKIYEYYEKEVKRVEIETLDKAIEAFNDWKGPALLYYNRKKGYFDVEVFDNDVQKVQTILSNDCFGVWSKGERDRVRLGDLHRKYIIDFVEMVLDGWGPHQAEYHLITKYPTLFA